VPFYEFDQLQTLNGAQQDHGFCGQEVHSYQTATLTAETRETRNWKNGNKRNGGKKGKECQEDGRKGKLNCKKEKAKKQEEGGE
jgi:hypothetical protein